MNLYTEKYINLNSVLHRWHPTYKIIGFFFLIFAFASVKNISLVAIILFITSILYIQAKLPLSFLVERLKYPSLVILGIVILLPFLSGKTIIWQLPFFPIIAIKLEGCQALLLITGRFLAIVTLTLILFSTTPFLTILKTLKKLGLSPIITDMFLLTYRYLFNIFDQLKILQKSAQLRGFNLRKFTVKNLQIHATLVGNLLIRNYEQSYKIYQAMQLRGYGQEEIINNLGDYSKKYQINNQLIPINKFKLISGYFHWDSILLIIFILTSFMIIVLEIVL